MNFVAHLPPMPVFWRLTLFITLALLFFGEASAATQEPVSVTDVSPNVLVFATSSGNVVASVGPDGVLLIGTPSVESTEEIDKILRSRTSSALRYVVIYEQLRAQSQGDLSGLIHLLGMLKRTDDLSSLPIS